MRFVEVCGTDRPAGIQRMFNISYQAAKNYLLGRIPDSRVLMTIANETTYSIHWLLTGRGSKFVEDSAQQGAPILSREVEDSITRLVLKVINENDVNRDVIDTRTVVLHSGEFLSEKVLDEAKTLTDKQP